VSNLSLYHYIMVQASCGGASAAPQLAARVRRRRFTCASFVIFAVDAFTPVLAQLIHMICIWQLRVQASLPRLRITSLRPQLSIGVFCPRAFVRQQTCSY